MADHPGVIFKDVPSGRRAALAYGHDVWEVINFLREVDERGRAAIGTAAEVFAVGTSQISTAISYYGQQHRWLGFCAGLWLSSAYVASAIADRSGTRRYCSA